MVCEIDLQCDLLSFTLYSSISFWLPPGLCVLSFFSSTSTRVNLSAADRDETKAGMLNINPLRGTPEAKSFGIETQSSWLWREVTEEPVIFFKYDLEVQINQSRTMKVF